MEINKEFPAKYVYASTVWSKQGHSHPCFAYFRYGKVKPDDWYDLPVIMPVEKANRWLKLLNRSVKFKYEFIENNQKVRIWPPRTDWEFIILFGNLTKGVSEFAWFCEDHIEDKSRLRFFDKNRKHFDKYSKATKVNVQYSNGHGWWHYDAATNETHKTKTLKQLFQKLDQKKRYAGIWDSYLEITRKN